MVVGATLQALGIDLAAVLDDDERKWGKEILGVAVTGPIRERLSEGSIAVVAIGANAARRALVADLEATWQPVVHPTAWVHASVEVGPGAMIMAGAILQPGAVVGAHAIVNTGTTVDHHCQVGAFAHLAPGVHLAGRVHLGEGALVGIGASVTPKVRIGAWTVVGAGAAVVHDLPNGVLARGVPAKVVRDAR
jgi:acetyltransferase EpsM